MPAEDGEQQEGKPKGNSNSNLNGSPKLKKQWSFLNFKQAVAAPAAPQTKTASEATTSEPPNAAAPALIARPPAPAAADVKGKESLQSNPAPISSSSTSSASAHPQENNINIPPRGASPSPAVLNGEAVVRKEGDLPATSPPGNQEVVGAGVTRSLSRMGSNFFSRLSLSRSKSPSNNLPTSPAVAGGESSDTDGLKKLQGSSSRNLSKTISSPVLTTIDTAAAGLKSHVASPSEISSTTAKVSPNSKTAKGFLGFPAFSPQSTTVEAPTSAVDLKPLTLQRVLSSTTPFLSWLKGASAREETSVVNPMLHFATFAMNDQEEAEASSPDSDGKKNYQSTIHDVLPNSRRVSMASNFWADGLAEDDSSEESLDSIFDKENKVVLSSEPLEIEDASSYTGAGPADGSTTEASDGGRNGMDKTGHDAETHTEEQCKNLSIEEKLQIVFDMPQKEKYYTEFACWLVRSLPSVPGPVRKEGFLQKRSMRRPRHVYSTYWFVLKTDGLYIYTDQKTPYYPKTTIYLKNVDTVVPNPENQSIVLTTTTKQYFFKADTPAHMTEWVEAIKAAVFNAKIEGNDVRVVLPFDSISEITITKTNFNNDSLRVLVTCEEAIQPEEYFFSYFNDVQQAYELLKKLWRKAKLSSGGSADSQRSLNRRRLDSTSPNPERPSSTGSLYAGHSQPIMSSESPIHSKPPRLDWVPPSSNAITSSSVESDTSTKSIHRKSSSFNAPLSVPDFREIAPDLEYTKADEVRPNSMDAARPSVTSPADKRRSWWGHRKTSSDGGEPPVLLTDEEMETKNTLFKSQFAIPDTERLLQTYSAYINRIIPLLGKIYVSSNYICFKSIRVGYRVKAVIAISDIVKLDFKKGYSPFYNALVITTKNDDEIIFDFHTSDSRQKCFSLLNNLLQSSISASGTPKMERRRSTLLQNIKHNEQHSKSTFSDDEISKVHPLIPKLIKSPRKMHITCLTIGTRGDVQPYIALCLALMADGHTCRIATHEEFQPWIEGFGIEFRCVKGNPAELMQLCVDYGMFTVGFIREGLKQFRGWIEELLDSCWTSVQGTDLLIESPTAFGGIHVAEALKIPFFSALPFPWTRTRYYPHPFGVTERHMGGSYNYMTYVMIEQILWKALVISVNPWRKKIGLPTMSIAVEESKTPFLYSFSPSVVPHPPDWQDWIHETGYWFLDNPDLSWTPPQSLVDFIAGGSKPVYIGFGSIVVANPDEITKIIVEAVEKAGVRAILSKGWSSRGVEAVGGAAAAAPAPVPEFPASIYSVKSVPHDWLFPQLAAVVHHGGAGTTAAGLRAGCPTIIHPFSLDQFFWADRLTDLGAGLCVRKLTVDALANALIQATTDKKMQEKAASIGATIRSENGVQTAVQFIYRDLDYAQKRILAIRKMHAYRKPDLEESEVDGEKPKTAVPVA